MISMYPGGYSIEERKKGNFMVNFTIYINYNNLFPRFLKSISLIGIELNKSFIEYLISI